MSSKMNSRYYFVITLISISFFCDGQVLIKADTIAFDCRVAYKTKEDKFMITSQVEYENSEIFKDGEGCLPFRDIDFNISILVGYKFRGSNCDRSIQWSGIVANGDDYLIQFATHPNHVCRDFQHRMARFVLDKPSRSINLSFERISTGKK